MKVVVVAVVMVVVMEIKKKMMIILVMLQVWSFNGKMTKIPSCALHMREVN